MKKYENYRLLDGSDYYKGEHREIRRITPKIKLKKKRRRYLNKMEKENLKNE